MVKNLFEVAGLELEDELIDSFEVLLKAYERWQGKINFTAIKDKKEFILKLFVGSIWPLYKLEDQGIKRVIDLGTGGGFPGLPLALCRKDFRVYLNDSVKKKLDMIADIQAHLSLGNIETLNERAEALGQDKKYRETFDLVTAQALASWSVVLELALPLVKVGGCFWAYQSPAIYEDLKEHKVVNMLGGEVESVNHHTLPYEMGERVVVVIRKMKHTPEKYPRASGVPKKNPL